MPSMACEGSRIRSTIFSPYSVGQLLTRKSMARVFDSRILMRPSCGTRRSAMSRRAMTFRRAAILPVSCTGGCATSFNTPSMRRRTRNIFSYGSKCTSEAPRRIASSSTLLTKRTIGASSTSSRVTFAAEIFVAAADLERVEVDRLVVAEARHLGVELLDRLVELALQLVVLDDDGLDRKTGLELDLVDGVQIGRVGDTQEQALAALEQRQHAVLGQQLVGYGAHRFQVDAQRIQVEQRHAVFGRRGNGNVARLDGAARDQLRHEAGFLFGGGLQRSMHAGFIDDAVLHQPLG